MKTILIVLLLPISLVSLEAQEEPPHHSVELLGTVSYNYSYTSATSVYGGPSVYVKGQSITLRPSCGYFLSSQFEILFDLQYSFSFTDHNLVGDFSAQDWNHHIGIALGASYNIQLNPFFAPFVGTKIGSRWSRTLLGNGFDTGWGKREIVFPDFVLGGRLFFADDWAIIMLVEYAKTAPYGNLPPWDKNESVSFALGFSVFL